MLQKFKVTVFPLLAGAAMVLLHTAAQAQSMGGMGSMAAPAASETGTNPELTDGEVRKIDKENKKVTLRHGPLKNLDMPGMTMVFQVGDDSMLDKLQMGDKIRFRAEKVDGKLTVTKIESSK